MRIGFFSLPGMGHLMPAAALARELIARGHDTTFFHLPQFADVFVRMGLPFQPYGETAGAFDALYQRMSRLEGIEAMRASLEIITLQAAALFDAAPAVVEQAGLDLWIVDQIDYAAATLAAGMRAPFVTLICGLTMHYEDGVPGFSGEPLSDDPAVLARDLKFRASMLEAGKPFRDFIDSHRRRFGFPPLTYDTLWSPLAQITQQPAEFEFPRRHLPACFHFTGPFNARTSPSRVDFPWELLDGRPMIYACFGTFQNGARRLYAALAGAVGSLDAQVVLSLGGADPSVLPETIPANMLVVPFAPQRAVLEKAALMVTHAGMNSTLECLSAGVPMVAVPISHDQPGVSARIEWTGTGVRIPSAACQSTNLRDAIHTVLGQSSYREAATRFRDIIAQGDGLRRAANIIEQVLAV